MKQHGNPCVTAPDDVTRAKREPAVGLTTLAARKSRQHAVIER